MEISTLTTVLILVVFLLVVLIAIAALYDKGNIFSGGGSICELTGGLFGGCS